MFPAIERNITRPPNAFITVQVPDNPEASFFGVKNSDTSKVGNLLFCSCRPYKKAMGANVVFLSNECCEDFALNE